MHIECSSFCLENQFVDATPFPSVAIRHGVCGSGDCGQGPSSEAWSRQPMRVDTTIRSPSCQQTDGDPLGLGFERSEEIDLRQKPYRFADPYVMAVEAGEVLTVHPTNGTVVRIKIRYLVALIKIAELRRDGGGVDQ